MKQLTLLVIISLSYLCLYSQTEEWELYSYGHEINDFAIYDSLAIIASSNGLVLTDLNNSETSYVNKNNFDINSNQVLNCYVSSTGYIYFSTDYFIYKVSPDLETFDTVLGPVYARDMLVDNNNVVWISDAYSLMRYDGANLEIYEHIYDEANDISLGSSIEKISLDSNGTIWICGESGIAKFDGNSFTVFDYTNSPIPQYTDPITGFAIDHNNNIWIYCKVNPDFGTSVLLRYDNNSWTQFDYLTTPLPDPSISNIADITVDADNNLWALSHTLLKFDGINWQEFTSPAPQYTSEMYFDGYGNKWFVGYHQLYKNDGTENTEINYTMYDIRGWYSTSTFVDNENTRWVSTTNGIVVFNDTSWNTVLYLEGLSENRIFKISADHNNNLWIIAEEEFIRIDSVGNWHNTDAGDIPGILSHIHNIGEIVCDTISDIVWFGGGSGVGTDPAYLIKYQNGIFYTYTHENSPLPSCGINDMDIDKNGNLWMATPIGIVKFDGTDQWTTYNNSNTELEYSGISSLAVDDYGLIWYCYESSTYKGVGRFDGVNVLDFYEFPYSRVCDIEFDGFGNAWFANLFGGILKYRNGYLKAYNTYNSQVGMRGVRDIFVDSQNNDIWISGEYGFERFHPNNKINPDSIRISGIVFLDENNNGILDENEPPLSGKKVKILPDGSITFTNAAGIYTFLVDTGSYVLAYQNSPNWQLTSTSPNYELETNSNFMNGYNYGIIGINDNINFMTDLVCLNSSRCDAQTTFYFNFRNDGTEAADANLQIQFDPALSPGNSFPPASGISGNTYSWNFENLVPGELNQIAILITMPDFSFTGNTLISNYIFNAINIENDLHYNNEASLPQEITCSYDPNDKTVETSGQLYQGHTLISDTLIYTIRFQNTGNDTAFNITIADMLDYNIDLNSFELISSSHNVIVDLKENHELRFIFDSIMLPDSVVNEPLSHGYVKYRVKAKPNTPNYNVIRNTAQIFFDNNPAVVTNTTRSTIVTSFPTTRPAISTNDQEYMVFPNPFSNTAEIIFENPEHSFLRITIYDVTGKSIIMNEFASDKYLLKRDNLVSGLYFFTIDFQTNTKPISGKFIIE